MDTATPAPPSPATPPGPNTTPPGPSMLAKRRIEAEILGHVYEVLKASQGQATAMQVIGDAVRRSSVAQAQQFAAAAAAAEGGTSLQSFIALSGLWQAEDALKIEVREQTDQTYAFDVLRCRYAEMYRAMGLGEIGHLLSCQRDGTFCEGYDPKLKFTRSQTIMQGASHCDFRYTYDPPQDLSGA